MEENIIMVSTENIYSQNRPNVNASYKYQHLSERS